jgi:5'-nucleotidase
MRLLLSNDDGYLAPGLAALVEAFHGEDLLVIAPERNCSGASNSLTIDRPLRLARGANGFWFIDGTPTDCVHLAMTAAEFSPLPDLVIGGVNAGENMGDDVLYSGTVAVAMEGRMMGRPAMAISLAGSTPTHFDTAARVARHLVEHARFAALPSDTLLNVNVPDVRWQDLRGFEVTRLGLRHPSSPVVRTTDPRGRPVWWVGAAGQPQDVAPGTDFHAVRSGRVSVTPLQIDLTRHGALDTVRAWMHSLDHSSG